MISREEYLRREYEARINRAIDYAYANCHRDFDLNEMADAACFSRFHFHRMFLAHCGETPGEFVRRLRLARAAGLLKNDPSLSITEIALGSGFSSSSAFARIFKEGFGVSASEYRRKAVSPRKHGQGKSKESQAEDKGGQVPGKEREASGPRDGYVDGIQYPTRSKTMKKLEYKAEVKEMPELRVAYARHLGLYTEIPEAFDRLMRWAGPRGLVTDSCKVLAIYYDDTDVTPEEKLRSDACITVPEGTKVDGDIGLMTVPGGKFAVGHFELSKGEFGQAWNALLGDFIPGSGWQPDDRLCYELYLNDEEKHPEKKFIVDICEPVKPM